MLDAKQANVIFWNYKKYPLVLLRSGLLTRKKTIQTFKIKCNNHFSKSMNLSLNSELTRRAF
jgi:hypothetical protein